MKTIKITEESHKKLKKYCKDNHLKMMYWASDVLKEKIEDEQEKNKME